MRSHISRREFIRQFLLATGGIALGGATASCRTSRSIETQTAPDEPISITILHVNDLHGALHPKQDDGGERGGAANLVGLVERKRAAAPGPVLLLDAGDALQGTYVSNSNYGQAVVEIMNAARVDALTLGNHEFDWGPDVLQARAREASFPFLAANLETASGQMPEGVLPYTVVDTGMAKVGILGLTYHNLSTIVLASAIEGLRSLPPAETVRKYLPELEQACDLIVVLSHLGLEGDAVLAREVPALPIIVGAHSHKVLHSGQRIGNTWIVQAGAYGQYLGQLTVHVDRKTTRVAYADAEARVIQVTDAGAPSAQVEAIVDKWSEEAQETGSRVIGETAVPLRAARGTETALGNLITDAMREADLGDGKTLDIALHNDGGIRADLDAGPITYAEMYAVLPFDNTLAGVDLTGARVKEMLESGINNHGSEIQVSGVHFRYSLNKARGRRVMEATVNGEPLDPERTYRVVTINYLHSHPQYEDSLGRGTAIVFGPLCLDAVIAYLQEHSPVDPRLEGRVRKM
jgi:2',3'-cyclic-nucleotide 2'-phosphodiesterase (5'-nucleotidase family)